MTRQPNTEKRLAKTCGKWDGNASGVAALWTYAFREVVGMYMIAIYRRRSTVRRSNTTEYGRIEPVTEIKC